MKYFHISDSEGRDAVVTISRIRNNSSTRFVCNGKDVRTVRVLENTEKQTYESLKKKYEENIASEIIENDVDLDFKNTGKPLGKTSRVYLSSTGKVLRFPPNSKEIVLDTEHKEVKRSDPQDIEPNIRDDTPPIRWTGKYFKKTDAIRKFVFQKTMQLKHTNGLTYDFLFNMASELSNKDELLFVGAGDKGNEPLIFQLNSVPYRGFLEGRVKAKNYQLLLHLSNLEMKRK